MTVRLLTKGRVLRCKTRPFTLQYAVFWNAKGHLSFFIMTAAGLMFRPTGGDALQISRSMKGAYATVTKMPVADGKRAEYLLKNDILMQF